MRSLMLSAQKDSKSKRIPRSKLTLRVILVNVTAKLVLCKINKESVES